MNSSFLFSNFDRPAQAAGLLLGALFLSLNALGETGQHPASQLVSGDQPPSSLLSLSDNTTPESGLLRLTALDISGAPATASSLAAPETKPAANSKTSDDSRNPKAITESQVVKMLEDALRTFTRREGEVQIIKLLNFTPIPMPRADAVAEIELISPNSNSRYGSALLILKQNDRQLARRNIRYEWGWKRPVWVARENHPAGLLQPDTFFQENRDILTVSGDPLPPAPLSASLDLIRPMNKGEVLIQSNLKPTIVVARGSPISAEIHSGCLKVGMKAVALENGAIGQVVRIQNPISKKELYGKVINENLVQVTP
ncbi:MAG: flagellar basal body P-ring formation chaperone FlgA [Verrucomicrobiae bacterium]|nr:flagellar basal body P-ring formation chaperone FlgA [Verrucomicrobiae bacterium]